MRFVEVAAFAVDVVLDSEPMGSKLMAQCIAIAEVDTERLVAASAAVE